MVAGHQLDPSRALLLGRPWICFSLSNKDHRAEGHGVLRLKAVDAFSSKTIVAQPSFPIAFDAVIALIAHGRIASTDHSWTYVRGIVG